MKILLFALTIAILFLIFVLPYVVRAYARTRANQIIYHHRPATEKLINRCIHILTLSNKWVTAREEPDQMRIDRLRDMLKEMQHPHG